MKIAKRILLFLAVNALVVLTLSFFLSLFHVQPYLTQYGLDMRSLALFCLIWGMGGAFISLALSRMMAKWLMSIQIISSSTQDPRLRSLRETVAALAKRAALPVCPEVGIFDSPEPNAFATGPTQRRSLVAVSSGLLQKMSHSEVEAVLGHEISHIANGDMVTMTLLQGVVNAFVMFLSRVLAYAVSMLGKNKNESGPSYVSYSLWVICFEVIFLLLGSLVIAWYSRRREFSADRGGALLAGKQNMIEALLCLQKVQNLYDPRTDKPSLEAFKIHAPKKRKFLYLFASHPPLEERIAKLKEI